MTSRRKIEKKTSRHINDIFEVDIVETDLAQNDFVQDGSTDTQNVFLSCSVLKT